MPGGERSSRRERPREREYLTAELVVSERIDRDRVAACRARERAGDRLLLLAFDRRSGLGEPCDRLGRARIDLRELRDDLEAHAVARVPERAVRRIHARSDPGRAAHGGGVLAPDGQDRARDAAA